MNPLPNDLLRAIFFSLFLHALLLAVGEPLPLVPLRSSVVLQGELRPAPPRDAPAALPSRPPDRAPPAASARPREAPARIPPRFFPPPAADGVMPLSEVASFAVSSGAALPEADLPDADLPEADLPDAAGVRQLRLALARAARTARHHVDAIRETGQAGTVEVILTIHAGRARSTLGRSSGYPTMDAAALAMIQDAAERTELPPVLRGRRFSMTLPVVFSDNAE